MNKIILIGRLARDPELRATKDNVSCTKFPLAVQRNKDEVDFFNCVAWRGAADVIAKYFKKGQPIAIEGRLQTGSYEGQDGTKRYTVDVIVENIDFIGGSKQKENAEDVSSSSVNFDEIELADEDLPF